MEVLLTSKNKVVFRRNTIMLLSWDGTQCFLSCGVAAHRGTWPPHC